MTSNAGNLHIAIKSIKAIKEAGQNDEDKINKLALKSKLKVSIKIQSRAS